MFKHLTAILFCLLINNICASAQQKTYIERLYDKYISGSSDTSRKPTILVLPTASYSPETKLALGAQAIVSFYTDKNNRNLRPSSIQAVAEAGGNKYKYIKLKGDIWTNNNDNHYFADIKYRNLMIPFYGTGANTLKEDEDILREKKFTILSYAEKKIANNWYAGIRAGFENYSYADTAAGGIFTTEGFDKFRNGRVLFAGLQQSWDTRNNLFSATRGHYFNTSFSYAPDFFKENNFTGTILTADFRKFIPLQEKLTLGIHAISQNYFSAASMPFYLMPQMGNDEMMRGYFRGRYRDRHYSAAQTEIRYRFIPRLSLAAFGGTGQVYGKESFSFANFKPNYGAGIRYYFDLEKNQAIRIDYGFGEKVPGEKRQKGLYFSLNEAF